MAWNLPQSGKIVKLSELTDTLSEVYRGQHVRVMARLVSYDCIKGQAVVCSVERHCSHQLLVDTRLVEPFGGRVSSVFQILGEMDSLDNGQPVLRARVVRCVDGTDVAMYYKALETQRKFFESRNAHT
ncbi:CST complex subunit TEN1-like [Acanthaster planci]|uniref:CST complex subunit TEN1-like n=1 Tax=Acanthaster planci TaxID=133434 RepID=A0A8B7ZX59_ACAPL|nr:CST complex subunit TEN1-like [Acanthaster planci]